MFHLMRPLLLAPVILLAACTPEYESEEPAGASGPETATESASPAAAIVSSVLAGVDLSAPLSLVGTEPFWGVKVASGNAILSRIDRTDATYSALGFEVAGSSATLQSGDLRILLTAGTCSDGMSDRVYPLSAEVKVGAETLKGCAMSTEQMTSTAV